MAWASLVFEVVGVVAGRGLGGHVSCPRPLPGVTLPASPECLSPQSRGWLLGCRRVACWWPWLLSMMCSTRVFDVVGVVAGRGVGCPAGRGRCRWRVLRWCLTLCAYLLAENWVVEGVVAVRCRCRWGWLFVCSMTWARLLAEVWVAAWPVRAPCLGVTRPASPECASPQCWGLVCGGRFVAYSWTTCGRCRCRWGGLCACSMSWA